MFGRVHGNTIELEGSVPALDGKRVRVVVEEVEDEPRAASFEELVREAPVDDREMTEEERIAVDEYHAGKTERVAHEQVRAKLAARTKTG